MEFRILSNLRVAMKPGPAPVYAALAVLAATVFVAGTLPAQTAQTKKTGVPQDWTHRHMVFSNPGTYEEAVQKGTVAQWTKITNSTRYKIQQSVRTAASVSTFSATPTPAPSAPGRSTIKKDWNTTLSGTAANLTGTVGTTLNSSTLSGTSTLTVDGVALSSSAPTPATATGTFSAAPTSATAPTITVNGGGSTITLTTNATAKTVTGTITAGAPGALLTGQTIVTPSNGGSITLTPGGAAATLTGSVSAAFTTGTVAFTYNNGGGTTNTLSLTPSLETQGNVVGTFTAGGGSGGQFVPGTTAGTFKVISGSNTATLTPNGYQYFTIGSTPHVSDTATVAGNTYTFETTPSSANQVAIAGSSAQAAQNLAAAIMADNSMCSATGCFGSGTIKPTNISASYDASSHTYIFNSTGSSITISDGASSRISESSGTVTTGSNTCSGSGASIAGTFGAVATTSGGTSSAASNMAAALNLCTNLGMTATSTALTVTATNTAYGATPAVSETVTTLTGFSAAATTGSSGTSGCTSSTTGQFASYTGIATTTEASNISAAINTCHGVYPTVGATSLYTSGSTFTLTAAAPGSAITLSGTGTTGFSWSSSTPGNDTGAGTCTSTTTGTFVNTGVANTLASNIAAALTSSSCTSSPGNSGVTVSYTSGNTFTVTANVLGTSPTFTDTGSTSSLITWGTVVGGSNGSNACSGSGPWTATFATSTTLTTIAADVTSAINLCTSGTTGVTATGNAVVSTTTPGSGASLTVGAANNTGIFSWSSVTAGTNGTTSSTTFAYWSGTSYLSSAAIAANIATAINSNTTLQSVTTGVSANTSGTSSVVITYNATGVNTFTVSASSFSAWSQTALTAGTTGTLARVQPNAYPAKFSSSGTSGASCSDFVVYPTGTAGATGSSTIVAYSNLYSGCSTSGGVPSVSWAYNTGTGYAVTTSPILSLDGTQVAFIQSNGTTAYLVLLTWAVNTGAAVGAPTAPTSVSTSAYNTCTVPCYTTLSLGANDTFSSPYYYYDGDILYVGDDGGKLHQFTGVFNGTPAENTTSPWPESLSANKLASPVYDETWNAIFVGDLGGVVRCVTTSAGTCQGGTATAALGGEIADAPIVDGSANYLIAFVDSDTVYGFSEQYFPGGQGSLSVGSGGTGYYLYAGTYDNGYFSSANHDGYMYVVGNTGVTTGATLYRITLSGGFLAGVASAVTGLTPSASGAFPWASPVSEFCNNSASSCALQTYSTCTVTSGSKTVTCTGAAFTTAEQGVWIEGTDIPAGTTVTTRNSATSITLSAAATGTVNGSATVTLGVTASGTDYVFFSLNRAQVGGCTDTAAHGCILSYNVSNPFGVAVSGTGLGVTTPGTNGCWATGGLVIDNSGPTTPAGGSQIYFVNLAGATAGNPSAVINSQCTSVGAATIISGVQTTQASP